jgi:hypothetical protein
MHGTISSSPKSIDTEAAERPCGFERIRHEAKKTDRFEKRRRKSRGH